MQKKDSLTFLHFHRKRISILLLLLLFTGCSISHLRDAQALFPGDPMMEQKQKYATSLQPNTSVSVQEVWKGIDSTTFTPEPKLVLYRNGEEYSRTPTTGGDGWYHFTDLPEDGYYYVIESPMTGYTITYTNSGKNAAVTTWAYNGGVITHHLIVRANGYLRGQLYSCIIGLGILLVIGFFMKLKTSLNLM